MRDKRYQLSLKNLLRNTFQIEKDLFYQMALQLCLFGNFALENFFFSEDHMKFLMHFPIKKHLRQN